MRQRGSAIGHGSARTALLAGLLGAGIMAETWTAALSHPATVPRDAIYTPAALRRALTQNSAGWLGRVVWVRARRADLRLDLPMAPVSASLYATAAEPGRCKGP